MFFNPLLYIFLAGVSLVVGFTVTLDDADMLLRFAPFLVCITLFCLTLFRPVKSGHETAPARYRAKPPSPEPQYQRLTAANLRARRPGESNPSTPFRA